jgi:DNA-binding IclR family transcriptional regulator
MSQDLVKSAARALEVLETFAERQEPMNGAQLGAALGYPKSSLSVLLKSLVAQGYLSNHGPGGAYFPTLKLARLGEWVPEALVGSEDLLPRLENLRDKTQETVTLTRAAGLNMRCIHGLIGTHPIAMQVSEGVSFPIVGTAVGTMYLATRTDVAVRKTLKAWAKHENERGDRHMPARLAAIDDARRDGFSAVFDAVLQDTGAIAMPLPVRDQDEPLIVAISGLTRRIRDNQAAIIKALAAACVA